MYKLKDISVVIPTYNRGDDLIVTLESFGKNLNKIGEVLIVDQSKNDNVKNAVKKFNHKKIKYFWTEIQSLTRARNLGVKKSRKDAKIISFLDDDVTLESDYFDELIKIFNRKNAIGVGGYYLPEGIRMSSIESKIRSFFFIENYQENSARVLSAYGAVYPSKLTKTIKAEWINGFNMAFKKVIFKEFQFDKNLSKYGLGEDFDFTYRVYKKYPGRLFLTPNAKLVHRASMAERYPTKKMAYMNQVNHFYYHLKNFRGPLNNVRFVWVLFGIFLLRAFRAISTSEKKNYLKLKLYVSSVIYCLGRLKDIRKGKLDYPE